MTGHRNQSHPRRSSSLRPEYLADRWERWAARGSPMPEEHLVAWDYPVAAWIGVVVSVCWHSAKGKVSKQINKCFYIAKPKETSFSDAL